VPVQVVVTVLDRHIVGATTSRASQLSINSSVFAIAAKRSVTDTLTRVNFLPKAAKP
jgi:hypothetical protein